MEFPSALLDPSKNVKTGSFALKKLRERVWKTSLALLKVPSALLESPSALQRVPLALIGLPSALLKRSKSADEDRDLA